MKKEIVRKNNTRRNNNYNGRSIFGERCVAKTLKLDKENAFDQCVQILKGVMTSEIRIEYSAAAPSAQQCSHHAKVHRH